MQFYSTRVSAGLRVAWGAGALMLARYEFHPPRPDVAGGIVLTIIALWCFVTAARIAWNIGRIKLWP